MGERASVSVSEAAFVRFSNGTARLSRESRLALDKMAEMIRSGPAGGEVLIEGHADRTEKNSAALSIKRARAVHRYLTSKGVPAGRLRARGFGATSPLAPSESPADRQKNRRVDFKFKEKPF
jgi:OOP family OmpA-OmpF porin